MITSVVILGATVFVNVLAQAVNGGATNLASIAETYRQLALACCVITAGGLLLVLVGRIAAAVKGEKNFHAITALQNYNDVHDFITTVVFTAAIDVTLLAMCFIADVVILGRHTNEVHNFTMSIAVPIVQLVMAVMVLL